MRGTRARHPSPQEIFRLLPHRMVAPGDLPALRAAPGPHRVVYGCIARDDCMVRRRGAAAGGAFDVAHYRAEPHLYDPVFHETVAPHTTVLVNGIYWDQVRPSPLTPLPPACGGDRSDRPDRPGRGDRSGAAYHAERRSVIFWARARALSTGLDRAPTSSGSVSSSHLPIEVLPPHTHTLSLPFSLSLSLSISLSLSLSLSLFLSLSFSLVLSPLVSRLS